MKLKPHMKVDYPTAKTRVLEFLRTDRTRYANEVAIVIWPDHQMTSQGAGAAASRILKRMEKEELVCWTSHSSGWGWKATSFKKGSQEYFEKVTVNHSKECNCLICFPRNNCEDCKACARHAYSDATTPGFFYDKCERHRAIPTDTTERSQ